jgi:CheY-like chemotaxis protein
MQERLLSIRTPMIFPAQVIQFQQSAWLRIMAPRMRKTEIEKRRTMNDFIFTTIKRETKFATDHPLRILIAEDHDISRSLLAANLRALGYKPAEAADGIQCLETVKRHPFDLLLIDIDMPRMDGTECAARMRQAGLRIPIIAVTASAPALHDGYQSAGINACLPKPVTSADLKRTLREVCLRKWVDEHNVLLENYGVESAARTRGLRALVSAPTGPLSA